MLIAVLTGSAGSFLDRIMIRAELEQLYATIYMMQHTAMMLHTPQTIIFDTEQHSYRYKNSDYFLPSNVRFGTAAGVKGPPSTADTDIIIPITFVQNSITCTPEGTIQPGAVYMTDRYHRYTYALSCAVGHVSYVRKYVYSSGWNLL